MKKYTVKDILALKPCPDYRDNDGQAIRALLPRGRKSLTLLEILELDFPDDDKVWIGCRLLPERLRGEFACDVAESVLHVWEKKYPKDGRPRIAIETKRRHMDGLATDAELTEAAAWADEDAAAAAWSAEAWAAAWSAEAWASAWSAAWSSAWAASAAWASAWSAAWSSAWAASAAWSSALAAWSSASAAAAACEAASRASVLRDFVNHLILYAVISEDEA